MSDKLHGIFTPHMVPLDHADRIDEQELRRYVEWLINRGVHGLYPNGSSGEFTRFTPDERREIVRIVCDQANGRVPVLAGAAEANISETLRACENYAEYGARAVAIVSPFYFKLSPESVYAYFAEIARSTPIDVTLYNIPMFASPIDVPTIQRLSNFERIIGIKDSSGDLSFMMRMIAAVRPQRPDFVFLTGWEAILVPMLIAGCDGGTHATSGVVPELTRSMYDLTQRGEIDAAMGLQYRLLELFDAIIYSADFPEGLRSAVEIRGFNFGKSRQPLSEVQTADRTVLQRTLQCILSDFGVTDSPADGCSARPGYPKRNTTPLPEIGQNPGISGASASQRGEVDHDEINQITQQVLAELRRHGVQ